LYVKEAFCPVAVRRSASPSETAVEWGGDEGGGLVQVAGAYWRGDEQRCGGSYLLEQYLCRSNPTDASSSPVTARPDRFTSGITSAHCETKRCSTVIGSISYSLTVRH
jgi:hypothetical protein